MTSEEVTLEIDCPLPKPVINNPTAVTDCENTFDVFGGFEGGSSGATETLILYIQDGEGLTEIGRTSVFDEDGSWVINNLDPDDLGGEGQITLVVRAIQNEGTEGEEITDSDPFILTIDCPPVLNDPEDVTDCEENFDVTGSGVESGATVTLFVLDGEDRLEIVPRLRMKMGPGQSQ